MAESLADRMRGLLASDVYTEKGRLRSDDLLVRERVGHGLSAASARIRELISLRAFGLSELDAVRYYVAMKMAENHLISAPNMAVGLPFNIGLTGLPATVPGPNGAVTPVVPGQ